MPSPGRGIGVVYVGKVTAVATSYVTVDVGGESYDCPFITAAPDVDETVWVLNSGRTMLVLGVTGGMSEPSGCWSQFTQSANEATFTMGGDYTVGVYGTFYFDTGAITFDGTPTDPELRVVDATNVDASSLDSLPGSWQAVDLDDPFMYFGWGWSSGTVTDVVFEVRWTGTAQVASFCPEEADNT